MDDHRKAHDYFFFGLDAERRTWYKFFAISLLFHVTLFAAVVFMPDFNSRGRRYSPSVMNVRMVTLAPQQSAPAAGPPEKTSAKERAPAPPPKPVEKKKEVHVPAKKEPVVEARPQPHPHPKPEISLAPKKIAPKRSLKKKTFKPEKIVKSAIRKLEKKTTSQRPGQIESALAKLEQKVKRQGPTQALKRRSASGSLGAAAGAYGGASGKLSAKALSQLDIYRAEVAYQIQKHWAFSEQLAGISKKLEAVLVIKILPSGEITDIWFEKRSGNRYLDDSAYKAIKKANPLPRLPDGYLRPFYNLGLIFTPSGLR